MKIRHLAHRTIDAYTFHADRFADFIQKPLDLAIPEDVRVFQLHMIEEQKLAQHTQPAGLAASPATADLSTASGEHSTATTATLTVAQILRRGAAAWAKANAAGRACPQVQSHLSQMALANRISMAELLFQSAWKSLPRSIRNEQGYSPAAMMVLDT
jgi:hypothetical protein